MPYSEQQIRGLAINFLRLHYKLRPRYLGEATRVVDKPHYYDGVLIDARLAFQLPDQQWFTATVEATGTACAEEVNYQRNYWRIAIHAVVVTLVLAAVFVWAGSQVHSVHLWRRFGSDDAWVMLLSLSVVTYVLSVATLAQWRGYRYIYAVDQFKRFHADAQWVAFDAEIFSGVDRRTRRRYAELERQCVRYGFGMLSVEADRKVRNVMSPSEVDQFGGERSLLPQWLARADTPALPAATSTAIVPASPDRPKAYSQPLRRVSLLRARLRRAYRDLYPSGLRRRPGYYKLGHWVGWIGVPALLLLGWGIVEQARYSPLAREGRRQAAPDLTALESATDPAPALAVEEGEYRPTDDTTEVAVNVPEEALVNSPAIEDLSELRRYRIAEDGRVRIDYDCVPLYRLREPVFLLVFGRYASFETARGWAEELNRLYRSGVTVAAGDCIEVGAIDYLVYLDGPLTEESRANFRLRQLRQEGLEVEIMSIE